MFVLLLLFNPTLQEIIAQSQINKCYANSTNSTECNDKMLITLTLENSQNITTEYIKINETTIDNSTSTLKTPVIISVTKTPVYAFYKLKYKSDYNSQPQEVKIPCSILSCDDSWYSDSPTCGFQYDSNKSKIFDSQGFCCSCGLLDLIGLSDEFARGNLCSQAGLSSASMAFCLRYSTLWYSAYEILTYSIYYNISISVTYFNEETEKLQLGSEVKTTQGQSLIARVIGDFTPLNPPPSLESFYLMKPTSPASNARVQAGSAAYMIVSKSLVGNGECNKIGVTYSSFRNEADSCKKQVNSCLKNQLEDFYQADLKLVANNSQPDYLLQKYGTFKQVIINNDTYLQYSIKGSMSTMITLEINTTGRIQYVVNLGKAKIDFAEVQNFESKSGNGLLYAQITNIGDISSEFSTYLNCSINVIPINSISLYLDSLQSQIISQDINVLSDMNKSNICNFSLLNNKGTLLDWKEIKFNTTEIQEESTQEHDEQKFQDNEVQATDQLTAECDTGCSVLFDIKCYILNGCNKQIITFFTILGCAIVLILLCCFCKSCRKLICCCCFLKKKKQKIHYIPKIKIDESDQQKQNQSESIIESLIMENKLMYLNLTLGTDPIPDYLESDISVEVLAIYQGYQLIELKVKKNSQFIILFKKVYEEHINHKNKYEKIVKQYFEQKKEYVTKFSNMLTEEPLFCIY